ncbi:MAG: hypothetical protein N2204_00170 [Anaerolineae bacterium]|nr:hypothetical protein [Anaerolineae bacterium]
MPALSLSERYAILAALALLFLVLLDNAVVMAAVSVVGLTVGLWVLRRGDIRRVAVVATVAFALALVFALVALLR